MRDVIIGTAGHVDHGKTALIRALTGVETDRLPEEKKRGVSIELGFAPFILSNGRKVGVIDVPGHEKFIKNMLSGITSIDLVLFVVAADEGIMPQTEEHLNIVDLLGVDKGIVALTKSDLVDEDMLELVLEDIGERFGQTSLKKCPIIPVSSITGAGIDVLKSKIEELVEAFEPDVLEKINRSSNLARLPVDRVFLKPGHGTIVTGTLVDGIISTGDKLEVMPSKLPVKVRQIQVHDSLVESVHKGQRAALNLAGLEKSEIEKGYWIASRGALDESKLLDLELVLTKNACQITNRQRLRFYVGAREVLARIRLLSSEVLSKGERALVQIELEEPVAAVHSDRFIIRTYSPLNTIGGGRILFHASDRLKKNDALSTMILENLAADDIYHVVLGACLSITRKNDYKNKRHISPIYVEEISRLLALETDQCEKAFAKGVKEGIYVEIKVDNSRCFLMKEDYDEAKLAVVSEIDKALKANNLLDGIMRDELRTKIYPTADQKVFNALIDLFVFEKSVYFANNLVSLKEPVKEARPIQEDNTVLQVEALFKNNLFTPPEKAEVIAVVKNARKAEDVLKYLIKEGILVRVNSDMFFHADAVNKALEMVKSMGSKPSGFTLAEFRDAINASRKYAMLLLDYFDGSRKTRREGDFRKYIG